MASVLQKTSLEYNFCPLTNEYYVMTGGESFLYPPDKTKSTASNVPEQKLAKYRAWFDEFDISYKVNFLKKCIYQGKEEWEILALLNENDRSCRAKLGCSVENEIIEACVAACEKYPNIQTVRKWIKSGDWQTKMEKYIQRNAKNNRN